MKAVLIAMLIGLLLTQAGCYSMHKAAGAGNTDVVRELVKDGKDLNEQDRWGFTPLIAAVYYGHHETAKCLVDAGADLNRQDVRGYTALLYALYYSKTPIAEYLVNHGADLNIKDYEWGCTALGFAKYYRNERMIKLLEEKGAKE